MATKYLQFDFKESKFYEYSKKEKEGFKEHENTAGVISYRELAFSGVTGKLMSVSVSDSKIGKQLRTTLHDGEDYIHCDLPLFDQKGGIKNYAQSVILCLGNMKKGKDYTLFPYHMTAEDQKKFDEENDRNIKVSYRDKRAVSIKLDNKKKEKVSWYLSFSEDADKKIRIPKLKWKKTKSEFKEAKELPTGKSVKKQTNFILEELSRCIKGHLKQEKNEKENPNPPEKNKKKSDKKSDKKSEKKGKEKINTEDLPWKNKN